VRGFSRTLNNGVLLAAIAVLTAGCAATRPTTELPELTDWDTRRTVLAGAEQWYLKGRIGVRTADDGFNAKLRWTQDAKRFDAQVSGPLGIGNVQLDGDEQAVTLTDKDGVETRLMDAEPELYLRYGWTIPVGSLPYWLLGIPDPNRPAETEIDAAGRLTRLAQGGWDVTFSRYDGGLGAELPGRITASSSTTRVRIVIDDRRFYALK
jgi:outer membrane lipoprotein LolB